MKQINDMDLNEVVGGFNINSKKPDSDVKKVVNKMFPTKTIKCEGCGKEIEVTDYSKVAMGVIGSEYSRILHYNRYCENCKKDHLWSGDTYDKETGQIVKCNPNNIILNYLNKNNLGNKK